MRTDGKDGKDGKDGEHGEHSRTHSMKKKMGSVLGWAARILPQSTSGGKGLGAERRSESEVERRVVEALRRRREEEEASGKKRIVHFNTLVMKFAKSDEAFKQIRKQFDQYGARTIPQDKDASQSIDLEELRTCLSALGVRIEEEEVMQLYREADMDCCDGMHFKEFILLLALLYLLQPNAHFGLPEVEEAFGLIADAFNFFDTTGEGFLTQAKVQAAMSSGRDSSPSRIAGQRFGGEEGVREERCEEVKAGGELSHAGQAKVQAAMSSSRDSLPCRFAGQRFGSPPPAASPSREVRLEAWGIKGGGVSGGWMGWWVGGGIKATGPGSCPFKDSQTVLSLVLPLVLSPDLPVTHSHPPPRQPAAEMDYNTDGQCTFKEFLFAYVGWVGTAEEEDDEEEEEEKEEECSKTPKTPKTPKSPSKSPKSPKSPRTPRHSGGHR
ncbi:unnamed protein product [Closterium sp. NIES-53]